MSESIAALSTALERAWEAMLAAQSHRQRKARNQRVITCGVALYERLQELHTWLQTHDKGGEDSTYLSNLKKYEGGWKALNAVAEAIIEWKRLHYEEISDADARHRLSRRAGNAQSVTAKATVKQARDSQVALAKGIIQGHRDAVGGGAGTAVQSALLDGLV